MCSKKSLLTIPYLKKRNRSKKLNQKFMLDERNTSKKNLRRLQENKKQFVRQTKRFCSVTCNLLFWV